MGEGTIKGEMIRSFLGWYQEQVGRDRLAQMLRSLPAPLTANLDLEREGLGILASNWYPARMIHELLDAMEREHGEAAMPELLRAGCEHMVGEVFRGVYRYLFRLVASPKLYARNIQKAWRTLHSSGERELVLTGPNEAESFIRNWPDHHRWLCLINQQTMRCVFGAMGYRKVEVARTHCVCDGHDHCRALVRFGKV
jgi:hypothetical protein